MDDVELWRSMGGRVRITLGHPFVALDGIGVWRQEVNERRFEVFVGLDDQDVIS